MARYFTSFGAAALGTPPVGWTPRLNTSPVWSVEPAAGAANGRALVVSKAVPARTMLAWDEIDADPLRADAEVYFRARFPTNSGELFGFFRGSGTTDLDTNGYRAGESTLGSAITVIGKYSGGAFASLSQDARVLPGAAWIRMRSRISGSTIYRKVWLDANPEPAGWTSSYTDASPIAAAGHVGIFSFVATSAQIDWVGFGTGGDTAPGPSNRRPLFLIP